MKFLAGKQWVYTSHCIKSIWMFFITKHFPQFISIKFVHKHSQESNNLLKLEKVKQQIIFQVHILLNLKYTLTVSHQIISLDGHEYSKSIISTAIKLSRQIPAPLLPFTLSLHADLSWVRLSI